MTPLLQKLRQRLAKFRRAMQWRRYARIAEADYRKPKNPNRVNGGKKSWETRRKNLTHHLSLAEFNDDKSTPPREFPALDDERRSA